MNMTEFFLSCGGKPLESDTLMRITGEEASRRDESDLQWNFGLFHPPEELDQAFMMKTPFHETEVGKITAGAWDGTGIVNHFDAALKVLGAAGVEALIQMQPRGTCGGRAGSLTGDLVECILIALKKQIAKFHRTSHAAIYFAARKKYNMLKGSWTNDNNDGVASGSVPEALKTVAGYVQREEIGDNNYYGAGSDDLACKLGAGLLPDIQARILQLGADNTIDWAPVRSAQELADGIAAGGIGIGSDSQGFTTTRDARGFCTRRGTWQHYQVRASVGNFGGVKGFGYAQSWGKGNPQGPLLPGHPSNCFGVHWEDQDYVVRNGRWAVVFGFPLWDAEQAKVDIDWRF